jgi:OOP family OmpA-OmpF porin
MKKITSQLFILAALAFLLAGCSGSGPKNEIPRPVAPPKPVMAVESAPPPPMVAPVPEPEPPKYVLTDVNFEFDKSNLTPAAQTILDDVASFISGHPAVRYQINGHTDSRGSDNYNQALSERRANSVLEYLESRGVSRSQFDVNAYGESQPVATNETDAGRAENRRVELEPIK